MSVQPVPQRNPDFEAAHYRVEADRLSALAEDAASQSECIYYRDLERVWRTREQLRLEQARFSETIALPDAAPRP
ncbi:hypothetical protein [Terrihabitans sp. B22-R8]|uniref:hypothetical protein n=1 Tax=Terrihabitans sp. B22-R8 TaxID=3425128 RepID=UPI00403C7B7D